MTLNEFCGLLPRLRRDQAQGPVKPYKPILLAALIVLIHRGRIPSNEIRLGTELKRMFSRLLRASEPDWKFKADIKHPFAHLETDGVWRLIAEPGKEEILARARAERTKPRDLLNWVDHALLDQDLYERLATDPLARLRVLGVLAERYLTPTGCCFVLTQLGT